MGLEICRETGFADGVEVSSERRRFMRHGVGGDLFVTFRPSFDTVGIVRDISQKGIGFEYTSQAGIAEILGSRLDIFLNPLGFKLMGVPYKIAYDANADDPSDVSSIRTRRCGVEFVGLTRGQFEQLRELIQVHAASAGRYTPGE